MPRYYVDLDNNKLVTDAASTLLARTPQLHQNTSPTVELELVRRDDGVLGHYTSTASALNVRVGTLGGTAVASALTMSAVTLSITATGTASLMGSVTATGTAALNSPVTGSITATFSQLQLPVITPVLRHNRLVALEIPTCGLNFSTVPSVIVSEPDIFNKKTFTVLGTSGDSVTQAIHVPATPENWPSVMRIDATAAFFPGGVGVIRAESGTVMTLSFANTVVSGGGITAGVATGSLEALGFYGGAVTVSVQNSTLLITDLLGGSGLITGSVDVRQPENRAVIAPTVSAGTLALRVTAQGSSYAAPPDIFIVPHPSDYILGASKTVTSALISGRTTVVTSTAHGLAAGSLIQVEDLNFVEPYTGLKYFGVSGVWPLVSVTTDSMTFRIDQFACSPSVSLSLATAGAKIYPITLNRILTGVSVACAGGGFAANSSVPFAISSDSCGGFEATGVVSVSNGGLLASARVTCAGSGFTTTSTVVTFAPYKRLASVSVTCAGAGYWFATPAVEVDSTAWVATAPGAVQALVSASLNGDGRISLSVACAGYGYTAAPALTIRPPNAGDGLLAVTVGTPGVGYADGTYACTVSAAPSGGTSAVVNFVQVAGAQSFAIVNRGSGYTTAPGIAVPAPTASFYYSGKLDLSGASVTSLLAGGSSSAAFLQVEEKSGADTTVLAQVPVTVVARVS